MSNTDKEKTSVQTNLSGIDALTFNERKDISLKVLHTPDFTLNSNAKKYLSRLKQLSSKFEITSDPNSRVTYTTTECYTNGPTSFYGWYNDPEDLIVEGEYVKAATNSLENSLIDCDSMNAMIESAREFLIAEGYSDIADQYYNSRFPYQTCYAANSLVDIQQQFIATYAKGGQSAKLVNCLLQAIGYSAIAELASNWAVMSRQLIIKAVGKVAQRYLGWVGGAIAVASFVDCMWFE